MFEIKQNYLSFSHSRSFPSHFDENLMFNGTTAAQLKADFREKFRNISKIMDCVGCDKCKLWGKLQVNTFFSFFSVFIVLLYLVAISTHIAFFFTDSRIGDGFEDSLLG